jgi:predicted DNA-binding transcriptional regulator YafY
MLLDYRDVRGRASRRVIWPILLGYDETTRIICAWCEARQDFRSFRSDRVLSASVLDARFPERPSALRVKWRKAMEAEWKRSNAEIDVRTDGAGARAHTPE